MAIIHNMEAENDIFQYRYQLGVVMGKEVRELDDKEELEVVVAKVILEHDTYDLKNCEIVMLIGLLVMDDMLLKAQGVEDACTLWN
jgi:hypothetical protein